jgi:putative transcriptional regulator
MADPLFRRSVCLVVHHDEEGAIGVLLNRPIEAASAGLWKALSGEVEGGGEEPQQASSGEATQRFTVPEPPEPAAPSGRSVHFGGPLSGPVLALHAEATLAEAETGSGVYLAAQKDHLQQLVKAAADGPLRLIVGHAGWQKGQLEAEIEAGFWYLLPATADRVFAADDAMWSHLVRTGVGHTLARWVGVDDTHIDPHRN